MQGARVRANGLEFSGEDDFDTGCRVWVGDLAHRPNHHPPPPQATSANVFFSAAAFMYLEIHIFRPDVRAPAPI